MSKLTNKPELLETETLEFDYDIQEEDYVFVIGPDGKLKSVMLPDEELTFNPPEEIKKIMDIYNVADLDYLSEPRILH